MGPRWENSASAREMHLSMLWSPSNDWKLEIRCSWGAKKMAPHRSLPATPVFPVKQRGSFSWCFCHWAPKGLGGASPTRDPRAPCQGRRAVCQNVRTTSLWPFLPRSWDQRCFREKTSH